MSTVNMRRIMAHVDGQPGVQWVVPVNQIDADELLLKRQVEMLTGMLVAAGMNRKFIEQCLEDI